MRILNAEQMRAADRHAIEDLGIPSLQLMENAAGKVADILGKRNAPGVVAVICGKGNNGGDGLALSRILKQRGWNPVVILLARAEELKGDPALNWQSALEAGVRCMELTDPIHLTEQLADCTVIVDAVFGTGLSKSLEGFYSEAIQRINRTGAEVVSIDVPSGLSSDTGEMLGPAIRASATVALAALKYCHVLAPACSMCGEIYVVDIGIPVQSTANIIGSLDCRRLLPHRRPDSHKGTYGHALVAAGSTGKSGAAYLAGKAALRCGAGLVTVVSPSKVQPVIASLGAEIMTYPAPGNADYFDAMAVGSIIRLSEEMDAFAIGPGIGTENGTFSFLQEILPRIRCAMVLDADALNLVARDKSILQSRKPQSTLLTPHPGEMARLLQTDTAAVQKDRVGSAKKLAAQTQSLVILKGYRTIIADPEGNVRINLTGGHPLASGGTGDVLTGLIAGFLAQGLVPLEAATAGVFLHGLAANLFEADFPGQALNAMDILNCWNRVVETARTAEDLEGEHLQLHIEF